MSYLMRLTLHGGKNREVLMTGTIVQIDGGHAPRQSNVKLPWMMIGAAATCLENEIHTCETTDQIV